MPRDLALPPVLLEQLRLPKHRYQIVQPPNRTAWRGGQPLPRGPAM
jgi:hypothetical protein